MSAEQACAAVHAQASYAEYRQLTVIDQAGRTAHISGTNTLGIHAAATGRNVVSAGNLLANTSVPAAIVASFEASPEAAALGDRILSAMQAGLAGGGEAGPIKSVGLILVDRVAWPVADLRIDWHDTPIEALAALWAVWQPQMTDYVTRALNPAAAPSYNVPGDAP